MRLRIDRWLWGCPFVAAIWLACVLWAAPHVEDRLRQGVQRAEEGAPGRPLRGLGAHVEIHGRDAVIVADLGLPPEIRAQAEREAAAVPGVRSVRTEIVTPVEMTPFPLLLSRRNARLTLTGGVPSAALHAELLSRIFAAIPADRVDDRLRLGRGEPPGFAEAARFLLEAVLRLPQAEGALAGPVFTFKGTAERSEDYDAVLAMLAAPPRGFAPGLVDLVPPVASPYVWRAARTPGSITLGGSIPSEADRGAVVAAAHEAVGGDEVVDHMQTARGLRSGLDLVAVARAAVGALGQVTAGQAELDDGRFAFTGDLAAKDRLATLEGSLRRDLPGGVEIGRIAIRPQPASPFIFAVRRDGGRVTLAGYVPDEAAKSVILASARSQFAGEQVVDRLHEADGAPEGFREAAGLAVDRMGDLAEGEARISGRTLTLDGSSLYGQLAERLRARVPTAVPPGWTAKVAIRTVPAEPPLDAAQCGDLLADLVRREPLRFEPGSVQPNAASAPLVGSLAAVVRRCGTAAIEILDRPAPAEDPQAAHALALRRASALAQALGDAKAGAHLSAAATRPEARDAKAAGSGASPSGPDTIEFVVKP